MLSKVINYCLKIIKSAKISLKLTIVYAVMFSLVLLILNASILYGIKYYLYSQANKQIEDVKTIVINKIISQDENINLSDKKMISDVPSKQNVSIRILKGDGKVLNLSSEFDYNIKVKKPFDEIMNIKEDDKHLVYKNIKIETIGNEVAYIQVVKDMDNEYDFMKILFLLMAIADFIGMIASVVLGYSISKNMLKPIDEITNAADNISINNLKERIEVAGPDDELKRLGITFNKMIDRLQDAFDRQIQFVSDASHELRTPIAVIQGYANLLDRWGKDDREALEKSINAIKLETGNMANLVEKLLFIAKGNSENQSIKKKEFMLNNLICEVLRESKIIDDSHVIKSSRNDNVCIVADYNMIKQMLRILIDNSIKFTPEHGKIDINSEIENKTVKITVSDSGIGIPSDEIQNIFERFYTVDKSRYKEKGGTGLGLSIARLIVEMHKGTINVESEEGFGTKITVILNI
ncbi:HAMP domain-containing histidine kinase [Clostridium algoriphilum]|uniref:sensor histidine kinase n=1 Tax=Clostridium algoriphilum TaxID=198347 RepID=UPI001CF35E2A|nr:ATP-binding protein [Clostridium algoriphilum]MCB2295690.1 HAMP domain-containing histidine kinase [Clostridium algoriphilum]